MATMITGGRGTLGRLVVPRLLAAGHEVIVTSRSGATVPPQGTSLRVLDLASDPIDSGVLAGVEVIVHAASNPARSQRVDVAGTQRLLGAAAANGVAHVVYPSIVGISQHLFPSCKANLAAERVIEETPVPRTILRATQFHEFLDRMFQSGPTVTVFRGLSFQVVDGGVVADRLVELAGGQPAGRVPDLGGPQPEDMASMATRWKRATGSRKPITRIPVAGKSAKAFKERRHHTLNRAEGTPTWDEWLATQHSSPQSRAAGSQPKEAGGRLLESAFVEIERSQVVVEVDVQPLAPGVACLRNRDLDESIAEALAPTS